jgi:hypothetical protein
MLGANSKAQSQTWRSHSSPLAIPRAGEFIDLLVASKVGLVVDVRTIPRSRTNPQYNREALPGSLSGFQIAYEHVAELGGRRARAMRRRGADCPVVVLKRGNARGAKGVGHRR